MTTLNSRSSSQLSPSKTSDIGILILTTPLRIVYANSEARAIASRINKLKPEGEHNGGLPTEILNFCAEAMDLLWDIHHRTLHLPLELRREIETLGNRLLLRGLGFPRPGSFPHSHVCVLMEVLQPGMDHSDGPFIRSTCHA